MPTTRNPKEFVLLLVEHQFRIYSYILAAVPNSSDADDVMQETCIALWEMFDQFQPNSDFAAWARSVARYRVLKFRERNKRVPMLMSDELLETIAQRADQLADHFEDRREALEGCLKKLNERDLQLVQRAYDPTLRTLKQVAKSLERPANTVYKALRRIRRELAACAERTLRVRNQ